MDLFQELLQWPHMILEVGRCVVHSSQHRTEYSIGVVNGQLKVYRTKNLRVVDASIIPLLVGTHIQALVYAIGAKVRWPHVLPMTPRRLAPHPYFYPRLQI